MAINRTIGWDCFNRDSTLAYSSGDFTTATSISNNNNNFLSLALKNVYSKVIEEGVPADRVFFKDGTKLSECIEEKWNENKKKEEKRGRLNRGDLLTLRE